VEGNLITAKRFLLVSLFALLQGVGSAGPSLGQSTEGPPKVREEVTMLIVVEAGSPHGEIVSGVYSSRDHDSGLLRYWDALKDELRDPRTGVELGKEVFRIVGEKVSKDIHITAEQSALILSKLRALGMSEASATRALEAMKRSLKRTAAEAEPKGKAVAGLVISTASKAYLHYLIENGMPSGAARANDYKVDPPRRPSLDSTAVEPY
jgi:hypothetical protein